MKALSAEQLFETSRRTRELVSMATRFLAGEVSRSELREWAKTHGTYSEPWFRGNPVAGYLHTLCLNLDDVIDRRTGESLVREVEIATHLRDVNLGRHPKRLMRFASVTLSITEVAARTGQPIVREVVEGLGWLDCVYFGSLATGRPLMAGVWNRDHLRGGEETKGTSLCFFPDSNPIGDTVRVNLLLEIFELLAVDLEEIVPTIEPCFDEAYDQDPKEAHAMLTRVIMSVDASWQLMRRDDHGNESAVATFSGYAKARAHLAEYEAKTHKQTYWLRAREGAAGSGATP